MAMHNTDLHKGKLILKPSVINTAGLRAAIFLPAMAVFMNRYFHTLTTAVITTL